MFKNFSLFICGLFLFVALSNLHCANSAVIGLDLGSEYMKISSISPGKTFYIVEDTTTKRKTPTSISFYSNERIFEYDTLVKRPKAFQTTFTNLPKYIGKFFNDPLLKERSKTFLEDYLMVENEKGTVSFKLKNFKLGPEDETNYVLKVEELLGMIFRHIKTLIQKQTDTSSKDIAVTVPPYWGFRERYALHDALVMADFNPLAFIGENTGAALYYALERQDNQTHTVIFYNLGATSLKVSLVEFYSQPSSEKGAKNVSIESFNVLAEAWDEDVGSLNFDLNLLHYVAKEFDNKPARKGQKSIMTSNPAKAKLMKELNKLKEVLSANKQAPIYIENLFDSTDLKMTIDRPTFEEINSELFKKLTKAVDEVLAKAGKTANDVDAVELIGGGIRVPKIQQVLSEHLGGKEVSFHLNGDESMTLGASFHAANLSASFKTRQINMNDGYNFDIRVELKDLEPVQATEATEGAEGVEEVVPLDKKAVLFPYKTRFGSKKILAFDHDGSVNATFYAQLPGKDAEENVISFAITGLKEAKEDHKFKDKDLGKPKINLHFRLTPLGFIELSKAEATVEEIILYEEPVKKDTKETKETKETPKTETTEENTQEGTEQSATEGTESAPQEPEKKFKRKTVTHHIPLKVRAEIPAPGPMSDEELEKSRDLLSKFDHYEEQKKKLSEAKNRLESFLYSTRDHLEESSFTDSAKEEEKEQLKQLLDENSEWMYSDEAATSGHHVFHKKFEDMNKIVSKVQNRIQERLLRPEVVEKAKEALSIYITRIGELATLKPWITEEARNNAIKQIEDTKTWLAEMTEKQDALALHEDPVVSTTTIINRVDRAKSTYERIKNTPKPKPPKNETFGDGNTFSFGKDGKYDEAAFKEYLKKMNVTFDDIKKKAEEKAEDTNKEGEEKAEGGESTSGQEEQQTEKKEEEVKSEEGTEETQEAKETQDTQETQDKQETPEPQETKEEPKKEKVDTDL